MRQVKVGADLIAALKAAGFIGPRGRIRWDRLEWARRERQYALHCVDILTAHRRLMIRVALGKNNT